MQYQNLAIERIEGVLRVVLNRPEKLNSLSLGLVRDLRACAEEIQRDRGVRAVVLTGSGRGFCAGADLTDPDSVPAPGQSMGQSVAARLRGEFNPVAIAWTRLPVPLVVALNGVAAGAGASIALLGDITVAARSSSLTFLFAPRLGLVPDMGATHLLVRRVGEARALALALSGARIGGEEAARMGLVAECVDDERLTERALELARGLAEGPREAFLAVRRLVAQAGRSSFAEQLENEAAEQGVLGDHPDFLEGVAAFREKRSPRFKPR